MNGQEAARFTEDDLKPLSGLQHIVFCERRAALIHVEGIWSENRFTAEGKITHERVHGEGSESRDDLRIVRGLRLRSIRHGLIGMADVVEFHRVAAEEDVAGAVRLMQIPGRWKVFPVEYKRGFMRHEESFAVQLCAQALCLEEMLDTEIGAGALYYGKSHRRVDVVFDNAIRDRTLHFIGRLHAVLGSTVTPPARFEPKCHSCSLVELCLPAVTDRHRSAASFLDDLIAKEGRSGGPEGRGPSGGDRGGAPA